MEGDAPHSMGSALVLLNPRIAVHVRQDPSASDVAALPNVRKPTAVCLRGDQDSVTETQIAPMEDVVPHVTASALARILPRIVVNVRQDPSALLVAALLNARKPTATCLQVGQDSVAKTQIAPMEDDVPLATESAHA
jgi:hypothetical protein